MRKLVHDIYIGRCAGKVKLLKKKKNILQAERLSLELGYCLA